MSNSQYWLLKAEPDSRIVKGKDVKFSVDDFEAVKTSPWEGVRNYEARNLMKEMRVGEKALFYQSNCKNPGVIAFAEISKEAHPDHSAWDPAHPYHDPKTDKDNPRWFMIDLTFKSRTKHLVPLTLLKKIAESPPDQVPEDISYIGAQGCKAIREMDLVTRGRLSVQRVSEGAWTTIELLAERGGWDEASLKKRATKAKSVRRNSAKNQEPEGPSGKKGEGGSKSKSKAKTQKPTKKRKRNATSGEDEDEDDKEDGRPQRKSSRS
ncbi:PUA-like domain-containing protein [Amanita rubescens]|nr:PUA-like domain-containing protein [Amanita rubescens]